MATKIEEIEGIGPAQGEKLRNVGIKSDEYLLAKCGQNAGLEAWAAERPILFARRHGLGDVADRFARWGRAGAAELTSRFVVPEAADEGAWSAALSALLADASSRATIGALGRELVRARFCWSRVAGELAGLYLTVLDERVQTRSRAS